MAHKAPGKHFRQGMTLIEAMGMFPDDAAAEAWFVKVRWPTGPACPYCGSVNVLSGAKHKTMPYRCRERECRKRFSVRTGNRHASVEHRLSEMGACGLSVHDESQVGFVS